MSPCEQYQELISRLADGDLSAKEERELSAHIENCPACAALYRAFSALSRQLGEDLEDVPFDLKDNVMAEIRREEIRRRNRLPVILRAVMSAAACVAVIVGVYLGVSLTKGAHLGVAAYESAVDAAAEEKAVVTEGAVSQAAPALNAAPSKAAEEKDEVQASNALRGNMTGGALNNSAADTDAGDALPAEAAERSDSVRFEAASVPAPAAAAEPAPEAAEEEAILFADEAEAPEADEDLEEWELEGMDLSLLRTLLKGSPSELSQEDLEDALFGRILLHSTRESWTVLLYQRDEVLYYLDPVEEIIFRAELTPEELLEFLG